MKKFQLLLTITFLSFSITNLQALEKSSSIRARGNLIGDWRDYGIEKNNSLNVLDGGYGLSAEYQLRILGNTYLGLHAGYNRFRNEDSIKIINNERIRVTSSELFLTINREFVMFEGYNLLMGIGAGVVNINTNETFIQNIDENNPRMQYASKELFQTYSFALNIRAGAMVPIGKNFFSTLDLDANILFANNLGIMPRIGVGFGYWLD